MKTRFLVLLLCLVPATSFGAAFYCAEADVEGLQLKVDTASGKVCLNGGPARHDFCEGSSVKSVTVQFERIGEVRAECGASWRFREFYGSNGSGVTQWVRVSLDPEMSGFFQAELSGDLMESQEAFCLKVEE